MQSIEAMPIGELMNYYLQGSQVANAGRASGAPGAKIGVFAETYGGEGYTSLQDATAWGEIEAEPVVVLQIPGIGLYALSYATYREVCGLLSRDLSSIQFQDVQTGGTQVGAKFSVTTLEKRTVQATAFYEIPPGKVRLFEVNGKPYAISLHARKMIRQQIVLDRRTHPPDQRREVIWHDFRLACGSPDFPSKPSYIL